VIRFQTATISRELAEALMLRSFERGILSYRMLPQVIEAWRNPTHEEFAPRTLCSIEQCFTGVLGEVRKANPKRFAGLTIRLQDLLHQADSPRTVTAVEVGSPA